ncbi:MAG: M48 family metallopeptidase [Clostridia bacterium]|nr:M48 family metallopeptidase [Clostridia bacterium]
MKKRIEIGGREYEYTLLRKRVKNINLHIKPGGEITVSANSFVPAKAVEKFLISKSEFIIKTLIKFEKLNESAPKSCDLSSGDKVMFLGKEYTLSVEKGKNGAFVFEDRIVLSLGDPDDLMKKKKALNDFYKKEAIALITGICKRYYPFFDKKVKKFPELRFRNMKTRWGVCAPAKNRITFNTRLVLLPPDMAEYVVCHEFTHFSVFDHSAAFYKELSRILPDYKVRQNELKKYVLFDFPKQMVLFS